MCLNCVAENLITYKDKTVLEVMLKKQEKSFGVFFIIVESAGKYRYDLIDKSDNKERAFSFLDYCCHVGKEFLSEHPSLVGFLVYGEDKCHVRLLKDIPQMVEWLARMNIHKRTRTNIDEISLLEKTISNIDRDAQGMIDETLRLVQDVIRGTASPSAPNSSGALNLDTILDKILVQGKESLTKEELAFLEKQGK
jgi:methyl coenzyme M reductase subunit D